MDEKDPKDPTAPILASSERAEVRGQVEDGLVRIVVRDPEDVYQYVVRRIEVLSDGVHVELVPAEDY